ncbi:uncharacterized protein LOC111026151 isoform X2 [Momordica charantia]|nr:uncharacterized protein LOC111026151 isoform X2 [Momordica charantia]
MNLESGKSFLNKDDVIGYIKSIQSQKPQSTPRRTKTQSGNSPVQLIVKTSERPEWLPDGWKVESRTRMSGSNVGGVYKCYIDPVTGNRFYSKPEVFRYLRTVKNTSCTLKERRTSKNVNSRSKVVIEHYKDEDLPPGWIKEIKIKEKADGIRKDPFYIDPKTGYVFRSKKDVLRYLETGKISRHAFKPKEGGDNDQELITNKISRRSTAKGLKLAPPAATPQPSAGEELPVDSSSELPGDQILQPGRRVNVSTEPKDASVPPVETVQEIVSSRKVVGESSEIKEKSHRSSASPEVEHPEGNNTERVPPDDGPISTSASESGQEKAFPGFEKPESNKIDEVTLLTTASKLEQEEIMISDMMEMGGNGEKTNTRKFKKKKKDNDLPRRSSKRLAGIEPELVPNAATNDIPQVSNGSSFAEVRPDVGLTVNADAAKACQQLNVGPERDNEDNVSNLKDIALNGNPSNKRKTPLECSLAVPKEKIRRVHTEKRGDGETEGELSVPIADFWSDPCLEFAIKTLTGALPVENASATDEGPVPNPTVDFLLEKSLVKNGSGSCMNKKTQVNKKTKNKKELTSDHRSPSINGLKPELASDVTTCEQANLHSNGAFLTFNLADSGIHGEPQQKNEQCTTSSEISPVRGLRHPPPEVNTEQSNRTEGRNENRMVLHDQHQKLQTKDYTTSETPLAFPFGDAWADPCLDFAFKTLTGAIPIEDSLGIQSYFEERLDSSRSQRDGSAALPDFGSPSFFQNDISSHFDGPEKSVSGQHLSLDPLLTVGNASLPSCSGFASQQQPCLDRNRYFKGR